MEIIYSIAVILAIIGAISVALGKPLMANIVWTFSNTIFVIKFTINFDLGMVILFSIYFFIALFGVINLSMKQSVISKMKKRRLRIAVENYAKTQNLKR